MRNGRPVQFPGELQLVLAKPANDASLFRPYPKSLPSVVLVPVHAASAIVAASEEIVPLVPPPGQVKAWPTTACGSKAHRSGAAMTPSATPSSLSHAAVAACLIASNSHWGG